MESPELDSLGMVVDFSVIKERVGGWITDCWDHNIILHLDDPLLSKVHAAKCVFAGREPFIMSNPTVENMAKELFAACSKRLPPHIKVKQVRLYETPSSWADFVNPE